MRKASKNLTSMRTRPFPAFQLLLTSARSESALVRLSRFKLPYFESYSSDSYLRPASIWTWPFF
jgi:hypothetical protein